MADASAGRARGDGDDEPTDEELAVWAEMEKDFSEDSGEQQDESTTARAGEARAGASGAEAGTAAAAAAAAAAPRAASASGSNEMLPGFTVMAFGSAAESKALWAKVVSHDVETRPSSTSREVAGSSGNGTEGEQAEGSAQQAKQAKQKDRDANNLRERAAEQEKKKEGADVGKKERTHDEDEAASRVRLWMGMRLFASCPSPLTSQIPHPCSCKPATAASRLASYSGHRTTRDTLPRPSLTACSTSRDSRMTPAHPWLGVPCPLGFTGRRAGPPELLRRARLTASFLSSRRKGRDQRREEETFNRIT